MSPHRIGLVGAGRMGSLHAHNVSISPRFELVAIADHNDSAARALAEANGAKVTSFADLLADESISAVIVASSTSSHLNNVRSAVSAGKAVFCEKPLSLDAGTLAAALPDLEGSGQPIFVAFNRRFDPHLGELKRRISDGDCGAVETLHIINHDPAAPSLEFVPRSGGLFKDFTIHDFDTAAWLLDEDFEELFACGSCLVDKRIGELGDIDTAKVLLRTSGSVLCVISNSRRTGYGYDQRAEVFGSKGALRVDNVTSAQLRHFGEAGSQGTPFPYSFAERYADAYRAELDHFADILEGSAKPATGPRDTLRALRLADAAERSFRTGQPAALSIDKD